MGYNHAKAEKEYKKQQEKQERLFRRNGMTEEQIAAIREFDEVVFNRDRAFYRRTVLLAEPENMSEGTSDDHTDTYLEEYWTELIDDEEVYRKLMEFSPVMRKVFYMYRVMGLKQKEISSKMSIPQQTISYWIGKIAELLK